MNCLRCQEEIPPLAPGVEQPSGICPECFGAMVDEPAIDMPITGRQWPIFYRGFEAGLAAMRKLLEKNDADLR